MCCLRVFRKRPACGNTKTWWVKRFCFHIKVVFYLLTPLLVLRQSQNEPVVLQRLPPQQNSLPSQLYGKRYMKLRERRKSVSLTWHCFRKSATSPSMIIYEKDSNIRRFTYLQPLKLGLILCRRILVMFLSVSILSVIWESIPILCLILIADAIGWRYIYILVIYSQIDVSSCLCHRWIIILQYEEL